MDVQAKAKAIGAKSKAIKFGTDASRCQGLASRITSLMKIDIGLLSAAVVGPENVKKSLWPQFCTMCKGICLLCLAPLITIIIIINLA